MDRLLHEELFLARETTLGKSECKIETYMASINSYDNCVFAIENGII